MNRWRIFNIVLFFIGWIAFLSCEKIIDLKESESRNIMVVNSIICPDSIFKVHLSNTIPILEDSSNNFLTDRKVEVYEDESLIKILTHKSMGFYYDSNFYPKAGKKYRIRIMNRNLPEAEATTTIPLSVPILKVSTGETIKQWGKALIINVLFNEPADQGNYYRISLRERVKFAYKDQHNQIQYKYYLSYKWIDHDANTILKGMGEAPEDQVVDHHSDNDYSIFADDVINGREYSLAVFTNYFDDKYIETQIIVLFQSISEEYYYYLKSRTLYNQVKYNPFAEPIRIYSNVRNGTGVFGGYSYSKKGISYIDYKISIP